MSVMWRNFPLTEWLIIAGQRQEPALLRVLLKSKADTFLFSQLSLYILMTFPNSLLSGEFFTIM